MSFQQYNFYPILTPVRAVSASNVSGSYFNGPTNNGVKATLTIAASSLTVDGVALQEGDRVLLAAQTAANQNGIYDVFSIDSSVVLQRSDDLNDAENLKAGLQVGVGAGTSNAGSVWMLVEPLPATFGVSDMLFESSQTPGSGSATFSNLNVTGTATIADENLSGILTVPNTGLHILDTNASHDLIVKPGSDLTADRILTVTTGDAARTLDISAADVTVSAFGASLVDDAAASNARTTLQIFSGVTANIGGGGAGPISVVVAGMSAASTVVASLESSSNAVQVQTIVATATGFDVTFSGDPGASAILNYIAIGA